MSEQARVMAGAMVGAIVGAAASYLFLTEGGRDVREKIEPAIDELRGELSRFQRTIEKVGDMANDGIRMMNEFNAARAQSYSTSH